MKWLVALSKSIVLLKLWSIRSEVVGLVLPIVIVWIATNEYKSYLVFHPENSYLGSVYILKWLVIIVSVAVFVIRLIKKKSSKNTDNIKELTKPDQDRFDYLRNKDKLESKADKILKGKPYE